MAVELALADALLELGVEINDFVLDVDTDSDITRASAVRALKTSLRDTHAELIARVVSPMSLHDEVELTQDSSDEYLYPDVPPRTKQILYVYDDNTDYEDLGALVKGATNGIGYRWSSEGIRLFGVTPQSTLYVWIAQEPPAPTYGVAAATYAASTLVLNATPLLGLNQLEKDYYVGAKVVIEAGTGAGQVRPVTAYAPATVTLTVPTWTTVPDATSYYSLMVGVPRGAAYRAAILGTVMILKRTYKAIDRDEDDLRAAYVGELDKAIADIRKRSVGLLPRVRQVEDLGFVG